MERGVLARLYRRLGPRYPGWALAAALVLQYGVFVGTIGVLQIYVRMSLVEFAEVLAVVLALQTFYAARVESATRSTGDDVLVTGATRRLLTRDFGGFDPRPALPLKGKSEDVELYAPRALVRAAV